jgi:hypothetical protein
MSQYSATGRSRFQWLRHALEKRSASGAGMVGVVVLGFLGAVQMVPNSAIVWTILAIILYEFQKRLDQGVPLLQLTSVIAVMQWLIGPHLNYSSNMTFGRYSMYVPEAVYFQFAIPATAFFIALMLSVGASVKQRNLLQVVERRNFFAIGVLLNIVAIGATIAAGSVGGGLQFALHLVSQMRYVGAIYFLFSLSPLRLLFAAGSCVTLVSSSLGSGMFHDLILWLAILFCYWFAQRKWVFSVKLAILSAAALALFSIQVIKQEYRLELKKGEAPSILRMVFDYVTPGGKAWETSTLSLAITRLNQGWIISAVMKHVPENEPFAEGETVKEAVLASIAPRFLWADKKTAGGRENFRRFTGLEISDSTSMGISPLGEAYANYGVTGGIGFMVLFGGFFALFYYGTLRYALNHPTFLFWIPLIFYQAMKAETELSVIMNQLTKGAIVAFGGFYLLQQVLPVKLKKVASTAPIVPGLLTTQPSPSPLARLGVTPRPK